MFIPRFWSEASHRETLPPRRRVTVRRFGWSSISPEDADVHARQRLEEALAVLRKDGEGGLRAFRRRERVIAYSGSDGLPIREEILEEHQGLDVVLTRNSYGAVCLNTTRAMFVDVDRPDTSGCTSGLVGALFGLALGIVAHSQLRGWQWLTGLLAGFGGAILFSYVAVRIERFLHGRRPQTKDPVAWTVARVEEWCESRRDWLVAVYETPAGARVLPLHAPFDAADEATYEFMAHLGADPLYVRMCRLQKCFRARLSPKPWRAGVPDHFPAGGTWPVSDPAKLRRRAAWVGRYDERSAEYASCRAAETVGRGRIDPEIQRIRRLHDERSGADSRREIA